MPFDRALCSTSDRARKRPRLFLSYCFVYLFFIHFFIRSHFHSFLSLPHNTAIMTSILFYWRALDEISLPFSQRHTTQQHNPECCNTRHWPPCASMNVHQSYALLRTGLLGRWWEREAETVTVKSIGLYLCASHHVICTPRNDQSQPHTTSHTCPILPSTFSSRLLGASNRSAVVLAQPRSAVMHCAALHYSPSGR